MTEILMSDELVGLIDESDLLDSSSESSPVLSSSVIVLMSNATVQGSLVKSKWDKSGRIKKVVLKIGFKELQDVLEGIRVSSIGFCPSKNGKTVWLTREIFSHITYGVDILDEEILLSVRVHYSPDI